MGDSSADQAIDKVAPRRDSKAGVLEPSAPALFGPVAIVSQRLIDEPLGDLGASAGLLLLDRDGDREMGDAVKEVGGPIERVDDPARLFGVALDRAAFLKQHAPVGACIPELLDDRLLSPLVGHRNEVGGAFPADLQLLDLAEVTAKARGRLAGCP